MTLDKFVSEYTQNNTDLSLIISKELHTVQQLLYGASQGFLTITNTYQFWTIKDGIAYGVLYFSPSKDFLDFLPMVERMIFSFRHP